MRTTTSVLKDLGVPRPRFEPYFLKNGAHWNGGGLFDPFLLLGESDSQQTY